MNAKQKHGAFDLAFEKFKAAYKSILALDRKKLLLAKAAGAALIQMKQDKRCTVGQLLHILNGLGINISQDTHNRYVNVATRWDEMVAIAKQRNINLETLGYMEALDLLPPSERAASEGRQTKDDVYHGTRLGPAKATRRLARKSHRIPRQPTRRRCSATQFRGTGQMRRRSR